MMFGAVDRRHRRHLRQQFWRSLPRSSYAMFLGAVFFTFCPFGFLWDIVDLGTHPPARLAMEVVIAGAIAVAYAAAGVRPGTRVKPALAVPIVVAAHVLLTRLLFRLSPSWTAVLPPAELRTRLGVDAAATIASIVVAYVVLTTFIIRQGRRYIRVHTEIALARDIHQLLVPPFDQRVGRFEFRGFSIPSGEVGGDLVDLVHEGDHWIGYVADVSGHGVGSGLLMAMVKSAARMKLREGHSIAKLMDDLNIVLMELKKPEMYVTFACMQFDGAVVQFSLAGHLPILHYQSAQASIAELSVPQIPLAMFEERRFAASRVGCGPGDLFVIVTDGLVEVFDKRDQEFGFDRLKALVVEHAHAPLETLTGAVLAAVHAHGPQQDDQTMLVVRVLA